MKCVFITRYCSLSTYDQPNIHFTFCALIMRFWSAIISVILRLFLTALHAVDRACIGNLIWYARSVKSISPSSGIFFTLKNRSLLLMFINEQQKLCSFVNEHGKYIDNLVYNRHIEMPFGKEQTVDVHYQIFLIQHAFTNDAKINFVLCNR